MQFPWVEVFFFGGAIKVVETTGIREHIKIGARSFPHHRFVKMDQTSKQSFLKMEGDRRSFQNTEKVDQAIKNSLCIICWSGLECT